jgi:hypothetical protein
MAATRRVRDQGFSIDTHFARAIILSGASIAINVNVEDLYAVSFPQLQVARAP